jgi:hypothetical protein
MSWKILQALIYLFKEKNDFPQANLKRASYLAEMSLVPL